MESLDYNFLADCLSTFRAASDWIKALIVVGFCGIILAIIVAPITAIVRIVTHKRMPNPPPPMPFLVPNNLPNKIKNFPEAMKIKDQQQ